MVTTNVIQRTFNIRHRMSQGTAFTIDRAGRQYLVTARHVVEGIVPGETIDVWHEDQWTHLDVNIGGMGQGELDIAVLTCTFQISPVHPLEADSAGMVYGQPAYILGFPYGRDSGGAEINRGLPIPFVKSGVISAFTLGGVKKVYVDTHANEGFSGGPVVFRPQQGRREPHELRVAGVVTGYIQHRRALHDADGNHLVNVGENTGIVVAVDVQHVIDLIDANPIGFELSTGR